MTPIRLVTGRREFLFDGVGFIALMLGKRRDWRNDIHRRISAIIECLIPLLQSEPLSLLS
jgi:hypothetical protein